MRPKLFIFLVLLCFSIQPFCSASRFNIGRLGKVFKGLEGAIDGITAFCGIVTFFSDLYNCSSLSPTVYRPYDTTDNNQDVSLGNYIVNFTIGGGDSPQNAPLIIDTTLDYTFLLCQSCSDSCSTDLPVYDPSESDTFSNFTCDNSECSSVDGNITCSDGSCTYNYMDGYVTSEGNLVSDTFTVGNSTYPDIAFGCGNVNTGNYGSSIGFLGLGYNGLSFTTQGEFDSFSYCLGSTGDGALLFGSSDQLQYSTYILTNSLVPRLFYLNFTGVSVGEQYVDIPSDAYLPQPDGTGGMFLDTTTTLTYLEESAYYAMKQEFKSQMSTYSEVDKSSEYGLDLCFAISPGDQLTVPQLTLHFDNGADMNPQNYSYFGTNSDETVGCLLVLPLQGISFLGINMQWDMQMLYDVQNGMFYFESADCSSIM